MRTNISESKMVNKGIWTVESSGIKREQAKWADFVAQIVRGKVWSKFIEQDHEMGDYSP